MTPKHGNEAERTLLASRKAGEAGSLSRVLGGPRVHTLAGFEETMAKTDFKSVDEYSVP